MSRDFNPAPTDGIKLSPITGDPDGGVADGNKGDLTVAGDVWTVNPRAITAAKFMAVGASKILGRHTASDGDLQEISIGGGLEFNGAHLRRSELTGDVTAPAGSNVTTLANSGVAAGAYGGASAIPIITVDAKGRVINVATATPSAGIGGTLGTTDNALTRADGTGGNTAQGSGVTLDDTATLLATNWTVTSGTFGGRTFSRFGSVGSNLALILSPTGTGFISVQVPDGTTAGGNLRGNNAIDLAFSRSAATQVASGASSFNGGTSSTASGTGSFAWCGSATNGLTFAMFGNASGNWSVSIGQATSSTANGSLAAGEGAQATGDYSAALCYSNAAGTHSVATGNRSLASLYGSFAHASGRFVSNGDCQSVLLMARAATTDATPTTLFLDGASQRFLVPANSRGRVRITAIAATSTAGGEMMTWTREVAWWRGVAASTTEVDVQTIGTDRGRTGGLWGSGPPWGFGISADTVNGGVNCSGTGAGATNIRWSMRVDIVMEVFP